MQPAAALPLIVIGALILGIALGRIIQFRKDSTMANSADALKQAVADHLAAGKAKDDTIASLNTELTSTKAELVAAQADLAADEAAIADSVAQLKPQPEAQPAT